MTHSIVLLIAFLLVALFMAFNGAVMCIAPRKWMSVTNRSIQFAWGKDSWFRYTPERMTALDLLQWRLAGVFLALFGVVALAMVDYAAWFSGARRPAVIPRSAPDATGGVSPGGMVFLAIWVAYGALLAIKPRWTLNFFGTSRHVDVSARGLWVWRVIGAGLAVGGAYGLLRSAPMLSGFWR